MNYLEAVVTTMRALTLDALGIEGYHRIWCGVTDLTFGPFTICPSKSEVVITCADSAEIIVVPYEITLREAGWTSQYATPEHQQLARSIIVSFREYLHSQINITKYLKINLHIKLTLSKLLESIVTDQIVVIVDGSNQPNWVGFKPSSKNVHHVTVSIIHANQQLLNGLIEYDGTKPLVIHVEDIRRLPAKIPFMVDLVVQLSADKKSYVPIRRQHTAPDVIPVAEFEDFLTQYTKTVLQNEE